MKEFTIQDFAEVGFPFVIRASVHADKNEENNQCECHGCGTQCASGEHDHTTFAVSTEDEVCLVALSRSQVDNLIDFIEMEFIPMIRNDPDLDNIDYVIDVMGALTELRSVAKAYSNVHHELVSSMTHGDGLDPRGIV